MSLTEFLVEHLQSVPVLHRFPHLLPRQKTTQIFSQPNLPTLVACKFMKLMARAAGNQHPCERLVQYVSPQHQFVMNLDVNETTQCEYYFFLPNPGLKRAISRGGNLFIDIGANVGVFSLLAAHYFQDVWSFEPFHKNLRRLRANLELSKAKNVRVFDCALSDTQSVQTIYENPMNLGGCKLEPFETEYHELLKNSEQVPWESHPVSTQKLDDLVKAAGVAKIEVIKIDVEGHEVEVIRGALETIARFMPILFVEVSSQAAFAKIRQMLPAAYKMWDPATNLEVSHWVYPDMIFATSL